MRHLDLFSGIGGFALATEMVWEDVEHVFCDNDPFSQAILKKHWPNALIYGDIKELTAQRIATDTGRKYGFPWGDEGMEVNAPERTPCVPNIERRSQVDLLTGGFPCQPFSAAGRRLGTEDDRHLWPEMLRVIREVHPTYVLGENVGGLLTWDDGLVFEQVLADLEEAGYETAAFVIPACALDAPHRRDRVWIVAKYAQHIRFNATKDRKGGIEGGYSNEARTYQDEQPPRPALPRDTHANPDRYRRKGQDSLLERGHGSPRGGGGDDWKQEWTEVAARLCTVDDGLSDGLVRPKGWRNAALKGAGNAIVPQVAAQIMKSLV